MNIHFNQRHWSTRWGFYRSGKLALELVATAVGHAPSADLATATVAIDTTLRVDLDEIVVKAHAENEGIVEALILAGIIEPAFTPVFVGNWHDRCARCRLTTAARQEAYMPGPHRREDLI